jgi:small subunit ribosomal protein S1
MATKSRADSASEFDDMNEVGVGDEVEVLLEKLETRMGWSSCRKGHHKQNWDKIVKVFEGDGLIKGKVKAVVKGGSGQLILGGTPFLPGSQIDIVPPKDLQQFAGNTTTSKSSRSTTSVRMLFLAAEIIEQERAEKQARFLKPLSGDTVKGVVKT